MGKRYDEGMKYTDFLGLMDTSKTLAERIKNSEVIFKNFPAGGLDTWLSQKPDEEKLGWITSKLSDHGIIVDDFLPDNEAAYRLRCAERLERLTAGMAK
jgi:hypothetical protein